MRRFAFLLTALGLLLLASPLSAVAARPPSVADPPGVVTDPSTVCADQIFEQVFLDWNDMRSYTLAPNGSFESGLDGWTVSDGVEVRPHLNFLLLEPGTSALFLPPDSTAISPPICVTSDYPAARLFGKTLTSKNAAALRVRVIYPPAVEGGAPKVKPAGTLHRERDWDATRKFSLAPGQIARAVGPDGTAMIRLRFQTRDASWLLDDVFVDPRAR